MPAPWPAPRAAAQLRHPWFPHSAIQEHRYTGRQSNQEHRHALQAIREHSNTGKEKTKEHREVENTDRQVKREHWIIGNEKTQEHSKEKTQEHKLRENPGTEAKKEPRNKGKIHR